MSLEKKVAVVILNFNGVKLFQQFLPSVVQYTPKEYDLYVIDNASSDGSEKYLSTHFPQIKCIQNGANLGFAGGYNKGLKKINADYYLLINSDIELTANAFQTLIYFLENNSQAGAVQPKILSYHNKKTFEYAGASGGFVDALFYPFCRGRMISTSEKDKGQYDDARKIFWASGAAMAIRAKVFHDLGGFDDYFFAHQEEIDLCWRMQRAGYFSYVVPKAVVYHLGGGTLSYQHLQKMYLNHRNNLIMITKNLPLTKSLPIVFFRILLEQIAEGLKELLKGNWKFYKRLTHAHIDYLKWLFTLYSKQKKDLPFIKSRKLIGIIPIYLIYDYYILGRRNFSKLKF